MTIETGSGISKSDQDDEFISPVDILIVEDVPEVSELLAEDLKDVGFCSQVYVAHSFKDALVVLEETQNISCVLVDWSLPDGEGLDLVKKLRSSKTYENKAIVMVSANDDINEILDAVRSGVSDYIVKPWNKGELKDKVGHALLKHSKKEASEVE